MGKESTLDHRPKRGTVDHYSGNPIRRTDNGMRDCDLPADQTPKPLEIGKDGLPVGLEVGHGDR